MNEAMVLGCPPRCGKSLWLEKQIRIFEKEGRNFIVVDKDKLEGMERKNNLTIEQQYNIPSLSYDFAVKCNECEHIEFTSIPKSEFIELLIVGEHDWLFVDD